MSDNVRELIEQSHACYEVLPYYILVEDRPVGQAPTQQRIQAGFEIGLYFVKNGHGTGPSAEQLLVTAMRQPVAETVSRNSRDSCSIDVMPSGSDITFMSDNGKQVQPWVPLRIRITHARGLREPAGAPEERALKEIQEQLQSLGVKPGKGR